MKIFQYCITLKKWQGRILMSFHWAVYSYSAIKYTSTWRLFDQHVFALLEIKRRILEYFWFFRKRIYLFFITIKIIKIIKIINPAYCSRCITGSKGLAGWTNSRQHKRTPYLSGPPPRLPHLVIANRLIEQKHTSGLHMGWRVNPYLASRVSCLIVCLFPSSSLYRFSFFNWHPSFDFPFSTY